MPRAGLTPDRIATVAADIADEVGLERLTLAMVASRLGVSGPALYKHVAGLDALRRDIAVLATRELGTTLGASVVGRSGADALRRLAHAYRAYARAHPGRLAASLRAPAPGDDEHIAASDSALAVLTAVLEGYGVGDADMIDALRVVRGGLHGFAAIEAAGGFGLPRDVDGSFERYLDTLDAGLRSWTHASPP